MPVTVYRSTDASAPTLSGTVGDLVNLLDKCLVTGYTGKTAAGWTKPYVGTNAAVFRMGGGNQLYLDVNDNAPGSATAQEARIRGYETMSAVATGTGPFPTVAQLASSCVVRKSAAASSTVRVWTLIADDRTFYLLVQTGDTAGRWFCYAFGDFYSYAAGTDNYRVLIIGRSVESSVAASSEGSDLISNTWNAVTGHYIARSFAGTGGSLGVTKLGDNSKSGGFSSLQGSMPLPNAVDGAVWLAPVYLGELTVNMRGRMRGFMHFLHGITAIADQDTIAGAGVYAGRTFLMFKTTANGGVYCIDITGPWDAN